MLRSMTAYGRALLATSFGRLSVEVQAVNRKYLEMTISLPKELSSFELEVRRWIAERVFRGQITVRIHAVFDQETPLHVVANIPLARKLKNAWDLIATAVGVDGQSAFHLEMLAHETELLRYEADSQGEQAYRTPLKQALDKALDQFMEMRLREGEALYRDIVQRLDTLKICIDRVAPTAVQATERYREKLLKRLEEFLPGTGENEDRLLREICLYAERIDVAEEITRFYSHLDQFHFQLASGTGNIGKSLEFLLQELLRESNTIASKSVDTAVIHTVVEMKGLLEQIREQLQNVE